MTLTEPSAERLAAARALLAGLVGALVAERAVAAAQQRRQHGLGAERTGSAGSCRDAAAAATAAGRQRLLLPTALHQRLSERRGRRCQWGHTAPGWRGESDEHWAEGLSAD